MFSRKLFLNFKKSHSHVELEMRTASLYEENRKTDLISMKLWKIKTDSKNTKQKLNIYNSIFSVTVLTYYI